MLATAPESQEMTDWYRQRPDVIRAQKKKAEAARNRRIELISRIASTEEHAQKAMPELLASRDDMLRQRDVLQTQLDAVLTELNSADQAVSTLSRTTTDTIDEAECELQRTTSPLVAEIIDTVERARTEHARTPVEVLERTKSGTCPHTQRQLYDETTTAPKIQKDVATMLEVRKELEALRATAPEDWQAAVDDVVEPISHLL